MSNKRPFEPDERLSLALAAAAYENGVVRIAQTDLAGYTHIVASRQGLFAVNETTSMLVVHGMFFGLTIRAAAIFAFESCDIPGFATQRGRIVRLSMQGDSIAACAVVTSGLDNGCHQIDFLDDCLCVLDTYQQRVLRFRADWNGMDMLYPLPVVDTRDWSLGYVHVNSLLQVEDKILLLLHNGGVHTGLKSAVAVFDRQWHLEHQWPLPGEGCHDIAILEDGTLLSCGSLAGELISLQGERIKVSSMMTRGLSVSADTIAVGASTFSSRRGRLLVPGTVTFLDRAFHVRSVVAVPGAPTAMRKLDGCDYSISAFVQGKGRLPR